MNKVFPDNKNQVLFEMKVLLGVNILSLNGNKAVKTINFPKWNLKKTKNFNPKILSDENILGVCKKFNEYFVKQRNTNDYGKYQRQIENLENPGHFFASWNPEQFYGLCQDIINTAGFTEQQIKNIIFFDSNKNQSNNQHEFAPNLEAKKESHTQHYK